MLVEFDFAVTQIAYVKAAMDEIPSFHPDGETAAQVQARVDSATAVRQAYVTKKNTIDGARALRRTTIETLHDACVDFLAQGRSRFRKDATLLERFARQPVDDQTFQETMVRAAAHAALWAVLPQVGVPLAAFTVGQGTGTLALAGFQALMTAAGAADAAIPGTDQDFQAAEAAVHSKMAELQDFGTAALELGRSQYPEGTAEREIIDAIPTEAAGGGGSTPPPPPPPPVLPLPTAPQNPTITSGATGSGTLTFSWEAAPTEQEVTAYHVYGETGLQASPTANSVELDGFDPGSSVTLTVKAENSTGEGPASEPATGTAG